MLAKYTSAATAVTGFVIDAMSNRASIGIGFFKLTNASKLERA